MEMNYAKLSKAELLKALEEKDCALKALKPKEKKASYNQLLISALIDIAKKQDSGAIAQVKQFIDNLKSEKSAPDKWNYVAFFWQIAKNMEGTDFIALKTICADKIGALEAFPQLGEIWGKEVKKAISAESR